MSGSVKLSGAQFKAFWDSDWGLGGEGSFYVDDVFGSVNGGETDPSEELDEGGAWGLKDTDKIEISSGTIYVKGENDFCPDTEIELVRFIRKWLKEQKTATLVIEVPKARLNEFKEYIKPFCGIKVKEL